MTPSSLTPGENRQRSVLSRTELEARARSYSFPIPQSVHVTHTHTDMYTKQTNP